MNGRPALGGKARSPASMHGIRLTRPAPADHGAKLELSKPCTLRLLHAGPGWEACRDPGQGPPALLQLAGEGFRPHAGRCRSRINPRRLTVCLPKLTFHLDDILFPCAKGPSGAAFAPYPRCPAYDPLFSVYCGYPIAPIRRQPSTPNFGTRDSPGPAYSSAIRFRSPKRIQRAA